MKLDRKDLLLYAVTDRSWLRSKTLSEQVEAALNGGATFLQLREKGIDKESIYREAMELNVLCKRFKVPFVINDYVDLALRVGADGVHVGQGDMDGKTVRTLLGPDKIMGVSVQTVQQAKAAEEVGADYLGVGAIFSTATKSDATKVNLNTLKAICKAVSIPVVAIGGITESRIVELHDSGIAGVAAVSAIFAHEDIQTKTRDLKNICNEVLSCD
jgi:thiamine-phosphate pyrophosphorylase